MTARSPGLGPIGMGLIGMGLIATGMALVADAAHAFEPAPPLVDDHARIHYHRPDGAYAGWGLHLWEDTTESVAWDAPLSPSGRDPFGLYWDLRLGEGAARVGFIIHRGDEKDPGADMFLELDRHGREVWIVSGVGTIHAEIPDVTRAALGDLSRARAHWLSANTLAWDVRVPDGGTVELLSSWDASLVVEPEGVAGANRSLPLTPRPDGLELELRERFPHLAELPVFDVPDTDRDLLAYMLRGQVAAAASDASGGLVTATGVQIPGVVDDLFAWDGPLGVEWTGDRWIWRLWAPTARSVTFLWYHTADDEEPSRFPMARQGGIWVGGGGPHFRGLYYRYEVEVFAPSTGRIERNVVTDPYSRSLSTNSRYSQILDLDDPTTMPDRWKDLAKPPLVAPEDVVLYELHVRDFSASDPDVPPERRGTYSAFATDGHGTRHLRRLAAAGVTHVHLLPAFDIATVDEDRSTWASPPDLSGFPPDSERQQAEIDAIRGEDGFNWGYDPYHFGVPEGSYAVEPDGAARIREFREMVLALSDMGLRVVMDVVYNHTHAAGQSEQSVLDRIVPGYYHRLSADGAIEQSTCCQNTATEHAMMERLMVDDLVHWARDYKIDGFRFDLMGHHMKRNLELARDQLHALTLDEDGIDGPALVLYGEGWDFGEVQGGARGQNATQLAMAGTGIGTFNDRLRDAVRGGSPFTDRREQGVATGLHVAPNAWAAGRSGASGLDAARRAMDRTRVGLAGNLADYRFVDRTGADARGADNDNGGYAADPQETINYVSAHDNETLFDKVQMSAPESADLAARVRMHAIALDAVLLGQGIPFLHAGSEILRSKSMDRDSYDSGDWFNRLDYTLEGANWGVGLPIADKNAERWEMMRPLLADPNLRPSRDEIEQTLTHVEEMLRIRRGSPLFRLGEAREVQARVRFHNTGRDQMPGLIVMSLNDRVPGPPDRDPDAEEIIVILNARPDEVIWQEPSRAGRAFALHPVLASSADSLVRASTFVSSTGTFVVPAWTTAVFVDP